MTDFVMTDFAPILRRMMLYGIWPMTIKNQWWPMDRFHLGEWLWVSTTNNMWVNEQWQSRPSEKDLAFDGVAG